jgi:hypothetical protein
MAESVHMALVMDQNAPSFFQNFLEAQLGSMVDTCFAEVGLVEALPMAVEAGALGRPVVGIVPELQLPYKDTEGTVAKLWALVLILLQWH